jgi:hypothetical protein
VRQLFSWKKYQLLHLDQLGELLDGRRQDWERHVVEALARGYGLLE